MADLLANLEGVNVVAEQGSTGEGKLLGTIEDDETVVVSAKEFFKDSKAVDSQGRLKVLYHGKINPSERIPRPEPTEMSQEWLWLSRNRWGSRRRI